MKSRKIVFLLLVLIGTAIGSLYTSCAQVIEARYEGTGSVAGNPMTPTSNQLAGGICGVITRCHTGVTNQQCLSGLMQTSGFGAPLGLSPEYANFSSIALAEENGTLIGNSSGGNSCYKKVTSLSCEAPEVQTAYSSLQANPFSGAANLLSMDSCGSTYTPVSRYACATKVFLRGVPNQADAPVASVNGVTYSVSPALPAGLTLNTNDGTIYGTPTALSPMTDYAVTATSPGGQAQSTIQIKTADGYFVNDMGDSPNTGGANCVTAAGTCTLRAAIDAAASSSSSKVIMTPQGNIQLSSATPLHITKAVEIYGDCEQGTVIDGTQSTQVFKIEAGPTTLDHLTVQNGLVTDEPGAGIYIGTLASSFTTYLQHITVQNNKISSGTSGFSEGAGIAVFGTSSSVKAIVQIDDCVVAGNINNASSGNFGGGISFYNWAQATINNCTISGNQSAAYAAGVSVRGSTVTITQSLFQNNSTGASSQGGGVYLDSGAGATVTVTDSTFSSNQAGLGGAAYNGGAGSTLSLINNTFVNNSSTNPSYGGAVGGLGTGTTLQNNLFSDNTSAGTRRNCGGAGGFTTVSGGGNISDTAAGDCGFSGSAGDMTNQAAKIGPLQNNGGLTLTYALLASSPGIDQGIAAACSIKDQRGYPRPVGGTCDSGAFEAQ